MAFVSLSSYYTQYFIIFSLSLLLFNSNDFLRCIVSSCSQLFIALFVSYVLTSFIQRFMKKELLSSYGKAVLITGCDSGFGNRLALKLNEHGFRVYATVFSLLNTGSQELTKNARFSDQMKVMKMDVTNDEEVDKVYEDIQEDLKLNGDQLWAVVNNAGITLLGEIEWGTLDTYQNLFDINVIGLVRVTRIFLPLIRRSKGRVVNVGSIVDRFTPESHAYYCMSKYAIISFSDALRREMHKWEVKVSTIEPGIFNTNMTTDENLFGSMDKLWNESTDVVKKDYGQDYFESQKSFSKDLKNLGIGKNLDLVINDMLDAIRNVEPQISYKPIDGILCRIVVFISTYIPDKWFDELTFLINKSKPKLFQDSE